MIQFDNWRITNTGALLARQYDHLTRELRVVGELPDGWSWDVLVQAGKRLDIIRLSPAEGGLSVTMTAEMLALSGFYLLQLRGTRGEKVRHTNAIRVFVPESLSGDAQWPTIPTEFTQIEQNIISLNAHPPYPGDAGYWMVWNLETGTYIQSSLPLPPVAEGPPGKAATIQVGTTTTGDPGTQASVVNVGDENAAVFNFTIPAGAVGPVGATPDISVQVTGLPAGSEPTVSVSGTPEAPVIALGIPSGQQGTPGQTPNITIGQVETLPAGSSVTASITGQTPNLVLNLGVPQGAAGAGVPSTTGIPDGYTLQTLGGQAVWGESAGGVRSIPSEPQISFTTQEDVQSISFDKIGDTPLSAYGYTYAFVQVENNSQSENKTSEFVGSINANYTHISAGTAFIYQNTKKYFVGTFDTSTGIAMSVNAAQKEAWRGNVQVMASPVFPGETIETLNFRSNSASVQIPVGTIIKVWLA